MSSDIFACEAELTVPLSLGILARQIGVNIITLQQQFYSVYGTTVFGICRQWLQRAREMLERDGVSVAEAARH